MKKRKNRLRRMRSKSENGRKLVVFDDSEFHQQKLQNCLTEHLETLQTDFNPSKSTQHQFKTVLDRCKRQLNITICKKGKTVQWTNRGRSPLQRSLPSSPLSHKTNKNMPSRRSVSIGLNKREHASSAPISPRISQTPMKIFVKGERLHSEPREGTSVVLGSRTGREALNSSS